MLGIVIEAQLRKKTNKRFAWPAYVMTLRARLRCPCCLLVITPHASTARWASQPIVTGPGSQLTPHVIGPDAVPIVTDLERAQRHPELAVLSAMAHGRGNPETALKIALSAIHASAGLDEDNQVLYYDLIEKALGQAARKALLMLHEGYKLQGPTFKKGERKGLAEGERKGKLEGQIAAVLSVLEARGIALSQSARERIQTSADLDQVDASPDRNVAALQLEGGAAGDDLSSLEGDHEKPQHARRARQKRRPRREAP